MTKTLEWIKNEIITYPAAIIGFVAAVLGYGVTQGLLTIDAQQTALIMAAITAALALVTACLVRRVTYSAVIGLGTAGGALLLGFDTGLGAQHVAAIIAAVVFVLGLLNHSTNSPKFGLQAAAQSAEGAYQITNAETATLGNPVDATVIGPDYGLERMATAATRPVTDAPAMYSQTAAGEPVSVRDTETFPDAADDQAPSTKAEQQEGAGHTKRVAAAKKGAATRARKKAEAAAATD